jgi:membrane protease YdiL (CAAX protease family)
MEAKMERSEIAGWQVLVLVFAVTLLAVPLSEMLFAPLDWARDYRHLTDRVLPFAIGYAAILAIPAVRRWAIANLSIPIPMERRSEVIVVATLKATIFLLAIGGATALFYWSTGGNEGLARRMGDQQATSVAIARALELPNLLFQFLFVSLLGPILEELVYRGWLYRALERRWGWAVALLSSSTVFGLYHPVFLAAFASSVIFTLVYRRTGALRASIAVHALYNTALWAPLLGQFVYLRDDAARFDIGSWWFHFACLGIAALAIPTYAAMAATPYRSGRDIA